MKEKITRIVIGIILALSIIMGTIGIFGMADKAAFEAGRTFMYIAIVLFLTASVTYIAVFEE